MNTEVDSLHQGRLTEEVMLATTIQHIDCWLTECSKTINKFT